MKLDVDPLNHTVSTSEIFPLVCEPHVESWPWSSTFNESSVYIRRKSTKPSRQFCLSWNVHRLRSNIKRVGRVFRAREHWQEVVYFVFHTYSGMLSNWKSKKQPSTAMKKQNTETGHSRSMYAVYAGNNTCILTSASSQLFLAENMWWWTWVFLCS